MRGYFNKKPQSMAHLRRAIKATNKTDHYVVLNNKTGLLRYFTSLYKG